MNSKAGGGCKQQTGKGLVEGSGGSGGYGGYHEKRARNAWLPDASYGVQLAASPSQHARCCPATAPSAPRRFRDSLTPHTASSCFIRTRSLHTCTP